MCSIFASKWGTISAIQRAYAPIIQKLKQASNPFNDLFEVRLAKDPDARSARHKFLRLPMFGAFFISSKLGDVLVPDDKERGLSCNA